MSRVKAINTFVMSFLSEASDLLSQEQIEKLQAKWKKSAPELKTALKPKSVEEKAQEAEENADKPKHFTSAYIFYCKQQRPIVKRENPEASATQIISILGAKWKALSPGLKNPFERQAKTDRARYDREMTAYIQEHPDAVSKKKEKKKSEPKNAYQFFYNEQRDLLSAEGLKGKDLQLAIFAKWRELKENKEELRRYKVNWENQYPQVSSEEQQDAEVPSADEEQPEVPKAPETEDNDKTKKRYANAKKKIKEIIVFLNTNNDEITMNMIKNEVKTRNYKISKENIKKIVDEITNEEDI